MTEPPWKQNTLDQWLFEEANLEVPIIYEACVQAMAIGYTPELWLCMVQYFQFRWYLKRH